MPKEKPRIKKKTIIEENIEKEPVEDEFELNKNGYDEIEGEDVELSPAEQMSELIDLLRKEQRKDFFIKIFKKYKNKKQWIDTLYEPDGVPDEAEIRDLYGGGQYELMLVYNDPETNKPRVKSISYNIFEPVIKKEIEDEEDYDYDLTDESDFNKILALMIERDKEFSKQIIAMQQNQFNMILNLINQQQTNMINLLSAMINSQKTTSLEGIADLIETIANVSGIAPEKNPITEIAMQLIPVLLNLQNKNAIEQKNIVEKIQASIQSSTEPNLKQITEEQNVDEKEIENS
jgi:hypothetical protein